MLNQIIETTSGILPIFFTVLVPVVIILFIIWLILKLTKSSIVIIGQLLKWGVIVFVLVLVFWGLINVAGGFVGA